MRSLRDVSTVTLLVALSLVAAMFALPPRQRDALLVADPASIELGEVAQGDVRQVVFHLDNRGRRPLQILDVLAGCDCTTAQVPKVVLQPGGRLAVPVTWHIGTRRHGVTSSVTVLASDTTGGGGGHRLPVRSVRVRDPGRRVCAGTA